MLTALCRHAIIVFSPTVVLPQRKMSTAGATIILQLFVGWRNGFVADKFWWGREAERIDQ